MITEEWSEESKVAGFEDGERGYKSRNAGGLQKRQGREFSSGASRKEGCPADTLILVQRDLIKTSNLQHCKDDT